MGSAAPMEAALNERQLRALELVRRTGEMTRTQYEAVADKGVSSRTAQNDLRELVDLGILERVGAGPGTRARCLWRFSCLVWHTLTKVFSKKRDESLVQTDKAVVKGFRKRYARFRKLLDANATLADLMADLEMKLSGKSLFGISLCAPHCGKSG